MLKEYSKEELWRIYKELPEELEEAASSQETADIIDSICQRTEINESSKISKLVGLALVGVLAPKDFQKALEEDLKIKKETAKKVAAEINRFIFYPIKSALEKIYDTEIKAPAETKKDETPTPKTETEPASPAPAKPDTYRETIEQ